MESSVDSGVRTTTEAGSVCCLVRQKSPEDQSCTSWFVLWSLRTKFVFWSSRADHLSSFFCPVISFFFCYQIDLWSTTCTAEVCVICFPSSSSDLWTPYRHHWHSSAYKSAKYLSFRQYGSFIKQLIQCSTRVSRLLSFAGCWSSLWWQHGVPVAFWAYFTPGSLNQPWNLSIQAVSSFTRDQ